MSFLSCPSFYSFVIGSTVLSWHWERGWTESGDDPCWVNTRGIKAIRAGSSHSEDHEQTPRNRIHSIDSQKPHWRPSSQDLGCVLLAPMPNRLSFFFFLCQSPMDDIYRTFKAILAFLFFFFSTLRLLNVKKCWFIRKAVFGLQDQSLSLEETCSCWVWLGRKWILGLSQSTR